MLGSESQDPNARIRTAGQAGPLFLFRIDDRPHEAMTSDSTVRQRPGDWDCPATPPLLPNRRMANFRVLVLPSAGVVQW